MARWQEFERAEPEMAEAGRALVYQFGVGLGFLATVRKDGGPRMHPVCLVVGEGGLWAFIEESPKRHDLERDGRVAVHTFPPEKVDDEFYVTGRVIRHTDAGLVAKVSELYLAVGATKGDHAWLYEFDIERVLWSKYGERPSWPPEYRKWAAPA